VTGTQFAAAIALAATVAAFGPVWRVHPGEPLWEVPAAWVLPHIPVDPSIAVHVADGVGSITDVEAALSWLDYSRAAAVWDEAHDANMWFDYDRAIGEALAAFRASDDQIRHAHRQFRCFKCAHPYVDEPTGEFKLIPRRHLGPSVLVGAV
jgi:hypothetical protein